SRRGAPARGMGGRCAISSRPPDDTEYPAPAVTQSPGVSVAARLNRLPPTRIHRHATIIAGIGSFFDLFDIFLAGVLGTVLTKEFALDRLSLPAALSSAFIGMFIGA